MCVVGTFGQVYIKLTRQAVQTVEITDTYIVEYVKLFSICHPGVVTMEI